MATPEIGIKLGLSGASSVSSGLSQIVDKLGDMDMASLKVGDALKGLGLAAVAALGVGSLAAVTSMVKGYIDAAEGLKDLGIKTGATVESLSAFASIGKLTGTTADTIGQAMNKLAKNMAGSTEESKGAAAALKALGLDFNQFNALRPEDKMVALAKAMNQFEDGSAKSAVAMTLMGKSGADLLPFMRDLGNAGELVAKVTAEQAEMADQYNDAMTIAAERTEDMKRAVALGLLPTLISLHDLAQLLGAAIREYLSAGAQDASGKFDLMGAAILGVGTVLEALIVLASDVIFVFKGIVKEVTGIVGQFSAMGEAGGIFAAEGRKAWVDAGAAMRADAQRSRDELDKFQNAVLGSTARVLQARDALRDHSLSSAENRNELDRLGRLHGVTGQKTLQYSAATKDAKEAVDQAAKAGQDYLTSLDAQFAALNQQISLGRELTKSESEILKLEEDVRTGKKKLTAQELESARAKLKEMDALQQQVNQLKEAEKARLSATKAGQDYLTSLDAQFAALNQQISLGRELTKTEAELLKLEEDLRTGKKALTDEELQAARAKLREVEAMQQQVQQLKEAEKATLAAVAAREKELQAVTDNTEKLREELAAQEAANLSALTGVDYTGQLTVAKLRDAAATADRNALTAMERQENDVLAEQYRQQAAGLRALAESKEKGIHIQAAKEANAEWQKVTDSINNGLTDALMRAFESGKGFLDAFKTTLVNAFKSMVLQPTIKAILAPVSGAIGSMFGFGNAAAATDAVGGSAAASGGLGSLFSGGASLLNGGLGNMLGLNLVNSGLGQALGLSSVQNIGGNLIAGPTGLGSMAASGLGMLGNGFMGYGISSALSGGYSAGSWVNSLAGIASAIPGIGPIAGVVGGLVNRAFGMKAKELKDSGITGSFTAGGVAAQQYQDWFQKGGWFRSNKSGTDLSSLSAQTADALNLGAAGVLTSTKAWAQALQLPADALSSVTTQFKVKLTGDATKDQAEIQALFGRYASDLAGTFQARLAPFQRAGEAIADTLQRLAGLQRFSETINSFGGVFSRVANLSVDAREQLLAFAGGMDAFVARTRDFVANYYTEAEQAGLAARDVRDQLAALGITTDIATRADFRALVESTDVSNEQGRQRLSQLLSLAQAFAPVGKYLEDQGGTLASLANAAPTPAALQALLSGPTDAQQATVDGLAALTDVTESSGSATVSTLERLIDRVGQLEDALVRALDRNARTVSDTLILDRP